MNKMYRLTRGYHNITSTTDSATVEKCGDKYIVRLFKDRVTARQIGPLNRADYECLASGYGMVEIEYEEFIGRLNGKN